MHYLLFYDVVDNYAERRTPFRKDHIAHAKAAVTRGELVLAGALANPVDGTVLLSKAIHRPPPRRLRKRIPT
jgi:uncharacterized protein YciI